MTNRKQSIFIALILSISMLIGATFFSNANEVPQNSEAFKGGSIDLVQNLNIHMYFSKSEVDALVNPTVAITYPDGSVDLSRTVESTPVGVDDEVVSCYIFTVECAVKDYDKPATVCIVGNGGETITASYSVKD